MAMMECNRASYRQALLDVKGFLERHAGNLSGGFLDLTQNHRVCMLLSAMAANLTDTMAWGSGVEAHLDDRGDISIHAPGGTCLSAPVRIIRCDRSALGTAP